MEDFEMKMMSPEKCAELLEQYEGVTWSSVAKLQIIYEFFDDLGEGEERNFKDFSLLSRGVSELCGDIIDSLSHFEFDDIAGDIKLFSPDLLKVKARVAYLRSIGIRTETPDIELENPKNLNESPKLGDV
jgi:hypothetical protein